MLFAFYLLLCVLAGITGRAIIDENFTAAGILVTVLGYLTVSWIHWIAKDIKNGRK